MNALAEREERIGRLAALPGQIRTLVSSLTAAQLTSRPLPREWSVAQNVHHLVDSHMNSYIRCKLILTEENPPLKPYDQDAWAALPDASAAAVGVSVDLLHGLHERWVQFWQSLPETAWQRQGFHPENGAMTLDQILAAYAAHGEGHINQIQRTLAADSKSRECETT